MRRTISLYVWLFSFLFPIMRRRAPLEQGNDLELYLYRGQYQLGTKDAMYSDGTRYRPMVVAFNHLKKELPTVESVLILGTGLASAAHILTERGYRPKYTFVEYNETILQWALELLPQHAALAVEPVNADAEYYMQQQQGKYDLVIIDIFIGRVVPGFATTIPFLQKCRTAVNAGRHLVMNYMINDEGEWNIFRENFTAVFPHCQVKDLGINRVLIATV